MSGIRSKERRVLATASLGLLLLNRCAQLDDRNLNEATGGAGGLSAGGTKSGATGGLPGGVSGKSGSGGAQGTGTGGTAVGDAGQGGNSVGGADSVAGADPGTAGDMGSGGTSTTGGAASEGGASATDGGSFAGGTMGGNAVGGKGGSSMGGATSTGGAATGGTGSTCTGTVCCTNGTPKTSGSCGTSCICTATGPKETGCNDGADNDTDGKADCLDPDCLNQLCTAGVTSVTVPIDMDTMVSSGQPTTPNGAEAWVEPGWYGTLRVTGFFGAAALSLDPQIIVSSASLRLYVYGYDNDPDGTLILELHEATGAWNEALTWNQAYSSSTFSATPVLFSSTILSELDLEEVTSCTNAGGCVFNNQWYVFNATSAVQAWMNGTKPNYGFAVTARPNNGPDNAYKIYSREEPTRTTLRPAIGLSYQATCNPQRVCPSPN